MTLSRVTYTNIAADFSGVHAHLDTLIPVVEARHLGRRHAAVIGGRERTEGSVATVTSPIDRELVLGEFPVASAALVDAAVAAARSAFPAWDAKGWRGRIEILRGDSDPFPSGVRPSWDCYPQMHQNRPNRERTNIDVCA